MKTWLVIVIFGWHTAHPVQHQAAEVKTRSQCTAAGRLIVNRAPRMRTRGLDGHHVAVMCRSRFEPI